MIKLYVLIIDLLEIDDHKVATTDTSRLWVHKAVAEASWDGSVDCWATFLNYLSIFETIKWTFLIKVPL